MRDTNRRILGLVAGALGAGLALALLPGGAANAATTEVAMAKTEASVRMLPTTAASDLYELPPGRAVLIGCWTPGEPTYGSDKYGSMWLRVVSQTTGDNAGYVHSFLMTAVDVPPC
jgi:hypothetical protein